MQTGHSLDTNRSGFLPWILVILLVLGIGGFVMREPLARMIAPPAAPAANPGPGLTGGGVLLSIQELSNLESVAFHYQTVVRETKNEDSRLAFIRKQEGLFVADGVVTAGVQLDKLRASDVKVSDDGRIVQIMLPAADLLNVSVTNIDTYSVKTGLFGAIPVDPDLHDAALNTAQEQITILACNSQILEIAAQNAERSIERLFTLMDGVQVIVTSRAPGSCAPASA